MERNQENERPLPPEQLIMALLEIDWDSDKVRIAMELYLEIVAKGVATPRQIDAALDRDAMRNSQGYYVQGSWKPVPKLKLVASYGRSSLNLAPGESDADLLVRRNAAWIGGAYYSLTDWLTLVGAGAC